MPSTTEFSSPNENMNPQSNGAANNFGSYMFPSVWATNSYGQNGSYELHNLNGSTHSQTPQTFNSNTNVLSQILSQPVAHLEYPKLPFYYQNVQQVNPLSVERVHRPEPLNFGDEPSCSKSNSTVSPTESGSSNPPPSPLENISSRGRKRRATRVYSPEDLSADEQTPKGSAAVKNVRTFKNEDERKAYQTRREKNNEAARLSRLRRHEREKTLEIKVNNLQAEIRYWHNEFTKIATPEQHQRVLAAVRNTFTASPILDGP
ncbi:hypothetical protein M3Y98_00187500 [Aphelenchoides besseyi]|nr:hypothetical protein M3Y98_00187500 [Aphelenchoides besseyi]